MDRDLSLSKNSQISWIASFKKHLCHLFNGSSARKEIKALNILSGGEWVKKALYTVCMLLFFWSMYTKCSLSFSKGYELLAES